MTLTSGAAGWCGCCGRRPIQDGLLRHQLRLALARLLGGIKRSARPSTACIVWFQRSEGGEKDGLASQQHAGTARAPYHPGKMPFHTCGAAAARRSRRARRACPAAGRVYTGGGAGAHTRHEHRGGRCSLSTWQPKVMPTWRHGLFSTAVAQRAACHERRGEASAAAEVSEQRARPRESLQGRAWIMGLGKSRPAQSPYVRGVGCEHLATSAPA